MTLAIANRFPSVQIQGQVVRHSINWEMDKLPMTMIMCDLVDSTRLVTSLSTEDFSLLLLDYYAVCFSRIERWQGQVIRYVGDGVLGLFDEDEKPQRLAERAIRAGIELRDSISEMPVTSRSLGTAKLAVRVSVVSGIGIKACLHGLSDSNQKVVFSQIPFLADRLKGWTTPNSIVICEQTAHLAGNNCRLENLGIMRLKGFPEVVTAWRVLDLIT